MDELHGMGLYLNDLNPHGLSKEMVMAGWQHFSRLELLVEKEEQRSDELETSLKLADSWKKQGDELLYSMIPRTVAEGIRAGKNLLQNCQSFEQVSVVFGELQVFNEKKKKLKMEMKKKLIFFLIGQQCTRRQNRRRYGSRKYIERSIFCI